MTVTHIVLFLIGCVAIIAAYQTFFYYHEKQEDSPMQDQDTQKADDAAKLTADEAEKTKAEQESKDAIEASHPARNNGHEHHFISGLAPGGKNIRICDVAGCGYTEGL